MKKMEPLKIDKRKSSIEIIKKLRDENFDPEQYGSLENYIKWLQQSIWKFHGIGLQVEGKTLKEKCDSLVSQLEAHGFLEKK